MQQEELHEEEGILVVRGSALQILSVTPGMGYDRIAIRVGDAPNVRARLHTKRGVRSVTLAGIPVVDAEYYSRIGFREGDNGE